MPTVYTETIWRSLYSIPLPIVGGVPVGPPLTYGRDFEYLDRIDPQTLTPVVGSTSRRHSRRKDSLLSAGLLNNASIVCIGTAFGFLIETLLDAGIVDVYGIEPSPYVWANTSEIRADVLPRIVDATVGVDSTTAIRTLLGAAGMSNPQRADWIVDEDAISSMNDDAEIGAFLDGCEGLLQGNARGRIVHLVTPVASTGPGDSSINWKTLAEWEAYRPSHTWIDARSLDLSGA